MILFINGVAHRAPFVLPRQDADPFWATGTTQKAAFNTVSDLIATKDSPAHNARLLDAVNREVEDFIYRTIPTPHQR